MSCKSAMIHVLAAAALLLAGACATSDGPGDEAQGRGVAAVAGDLSDQGLARISRHMDPAMLALARRHDPRPQRDFWGRPQGWETLRLAEVPSLGFRTAFDHSARRINALRPVAALPVHPMQPFILRTGGAERARALHCLTQAVYYEAAREPLVGQRAVAQTVLNRLRHPAYPNSICGVVYQGSARATGCQFTFTCDGSLQWAPEPALWARAQTVAREALDGFVLKEIGPATHYHADYVAPYWAPTLVKLTKIGAHIFYRWTGPAGEPAAFTGRYGGGEAALTPAILHGGDVRTQGPQAEAVNARPGRQVVLEVGGEARTYTVREPGPEDDARAPLAGALQPTRRPPTAEEVRQVNEALARLEQDLDRKAAAE